MNLRPSGYEPDELPGCSTPRQFSFIWPQQSEITDLKPKRAVTGPLKLFIIVKKIVLFLSAYYALDRSGDDLLSHTLRCSTIGAEGLHGRVRNGIGCCPLAIITGSTQCVIEEMSWPRTKSRTITIKWLLYGYKFSVLGLLLHTNK